jgi:hypothetical protein
MEISMDGHRMPVFIDGCVLKIIAMVSMFIDHMAIALIGNNSSVMSASFMLWDRQIKMEQVYNAMRGVGRLAFPIYCFLLVEGFVHTSSVKKYLIRLGIFAIISEIPFNLLLYQSVTGIGHQNVFFTLFIGLLTMQLYSRLQGLGIRETAGRWCTLIAGCVIAECLRTDYGAYGILMIFAIYIYREKHIYRDFMLALLAIVEPSERMALLSLVPITFYNGKRGAQIKWLGYFFYPVHLLLLYGLGMLVRYGFVLQHIL